MIDLGFLKGQKVAVLGLGKTGLPSAVALAKAGAEVLLWDDNPVSRDQAAQHGLTASDLATANLDGITFLLLSPGIPHSFPAPHPIVARFQQAGIPLISDIELLRRAEPQARLVAITGTNGKSTTTALIAHILAVTGRDIRVGGNLGPAVLAFDPSGPATIHVLELSSYQLELTPSLNADVAVLLNITPDHLNRHGGMEGYVAAKARVFDGAETAIIGIDDEYCQKLIKQFAARSALPPLLEIITLSLDNSAADIIFADSHLRDNRTSFTHALNGFPTLPGRHNAQNAAAAYAACLALGLSPQEIMAAMVSFPGLAHRQQRVATVKGIDYINDSKATNADAAAKALACYDDIYWIAGGQPKEGGLAGLESLMPRVRHAFLIGEAATDFGSWLAGKVRYSHCGSLDRAIAAAAAMAQADALPGAVVLLSPACASWDQFRSFEHRGEMFTEIAQKLSQGEVA